MQAEFQLDVVVRPLRYEAPLPPRNGFIVLASLNLLSAEPGGGAETTFTVFYDIVAMDTVLKRLTLEIHIVDVQDNELNNAPFSVIVVAP